MPGAESPSGQYGRLIETAILSVHIGQNMGEIISPPFFLSLPASNDGRIKMIA